MQNANRTH